MLLLTCPWCGSRSEIEFVCGGETQPNRPSPPEAVSDQAWADYLFARANLKGATTERWLHRHGCGQWFGVERDTVTHTIRRCFPFGQPANESPTREGG